MSAAKALEEHFRQFYTRKRSRDDGGVVQFGTLKALVFVLLPVVAACSASNLDYRAPAGFDLSGTWVLNEYLSERPPSSAEIRRREDEQVLRGQRRGAATSSAFLVQDFPVLGIDRMVIEQNRDSMGIEYGNGAYRDVSWGRRERNFWNVHAGWGDDTLFILSDRKGIDGTEAMTLEEGGKRLRVVVSVESAGQHVRVDRVFDRR